MGSRNKIIINASNIHTGGGKVVIEDLLYSLKSFKLYNFICFIDGRRNDSSMKISNVEIHKVSKKDRLLIWNKIEKSSTISDIIIYFTNIPPRKRHKCKTYLFLQNRFVIDNFSLKGFTIKTKLRIFIERLLFIINFKNCDKIIVQSNTMKTILNKKGIPDKLILELPFFFNRKELFRNNKKRNVSKTFLYVASDDPYKNHIRLINSWIMLSKDKIFPKLIVTINKNSKLHTYIEQMKKKYNIIVETKSYLTRSQIFKLYHNVDALIYPSLFESYALPLVEAKFIETPVVSSELDFVRDILDPVETFDPYSEKSIYRSVKRFLNSSDQKTDIITPTEFLENIQN